MCKVVFAGEEGIDAGGVRKEFFQLLVQRLFAAHSGLFVTVDSERFIKCAALIFLLYLFSLTSAAYHVFTSI